MACRNQFAANQSRLALGRAFERQHTIYTQDIFDLDTKLIVYKNSNFVVEVARS